MNEYLTIEQVEAKYPQEWVVLDRLKKDRSGEVVGGVVVAHAADQATVLHAQEKLPKPFDLMCWYTGRIPEDMVFLL